MCFVLNKYVLHDKGGWVGCFVHVSYNCLVDKELTWHLPGSKTDHMALGVERTPPCFCGLDAIPCPYHLALEHMQWLRASKHSDEGTAILFPTSGGLAPSKAALIRTFELLGE